MGPARCSPSTAPAGKVTLLARINGHGQCWPTSWELIPGRSFDALRRPSSRRRSPDIVVAQQHPSVMRAVTFLLTDIEGSTAAWEADAAAMAVGAGPTRRTCRAGRHVTRRTADQDTRRRRRHVLGLRATIGSGRGRYGATRCDQPRAVESPRADAHPDRAAHRRSRAPRRRLLRSGGGPRRPLEIAGCGWSNFVLWRDGQACR